MQFCKCVNEPFKYVYNRHNNKNIKRYYKLRVNMEDKSEALSNRIAEIKLRRIQEFNSRLKEALLRDRIPASNASLLYVFISQLKILDKD